MNENKPIISYCGLFCSECFSHVGRIADLSRDLRKELRQERFDKTAESLSAVSFFKIFNKYPDCYEVLGAMVRLRCKKGCREGGGDPFCAIRRCCVKKGFEGCWECEEFEDCRKMDFLKVKSTGIQKSNRDSAGYGEMAELVESARLEIECTAEKQYRGFESHSLRQLEKEIFI
jgi:hypothetical protein